MSFDAFETRAVEGLLEPENLGQDEEEGGSWGGGGGEDEEEEEERKEMLVTNIML